MSVSKHSQKFADFLESFYTLGKVSGVAICCLESLVSGKYLRLMSMKQSDRQILLISYADHNYNSTKN